MRLRLRKKDRDVPELNTTSTADISFMLLVFFLVTTSMDTDKGLDKQLPPPEDDKVELATVKTNTMLNIRVDANDNISVNDSLADTQVLIAQVKDFVSTVGKSHIITIDTDENASYEAYFKVQDAVKTAYAELRNDASRKLYGRRFSLLGQAEKDRIRQMFPQRVTEKTNGEDI